MDLKERIRRRQRTGKEGGIVLEYDAVSPVAHVEEPTGRGPTLERLLDYLDPVFDGSLPPNAYVWGPSGAGKSALVTALFSRFSQLLSRSDPVIHTTTRAQTGPSPAFVYVDARRADSAFSLYHDVLDGLVDDQVPRKGVGTDAMRTRLVEELEPPDRGVVVAVDHVTDDRTLDLGTVADLLDAVSDSLAWVAVGRDAPEALASSTVPPERIEVPAYETHALVDVLTSRGSDGLTRQALEHEQVRRLAAWADGDAHDGLAAMFSAADIATEAGHDTIQERDLEAGMNAVPRPSTPLGRVLTLPENRQRVLRELVDLEDREASPVGETAQRIADRPGVDLSAGTVKRFLYELAEEGITERLALERVEDGGGRPPSRLEPRFPTLVFRRLFDRQYE